MHISLIIFGKPKDFALHWERNHKYDRLAQTGTDGVDPFFHDVSLLLQNEEGFTNNPQKSKTYTYLLEFLMHLVV